MADPDLQIRGLGGGGGGEAVFKNFFWPFGPQFRLKISGGGGGPHGSLPRSATATPDSFCATTKIIRDRAPVNTKERLWRREETPRRRSLKQSHISDRCSTIPV